MNAKIEMTKDETAVLKAIQSGSRFYLTIASWVGFGGTFEAEGTARLTGALRSLEDAGLIHYAGEVDGYRARRF